MGQGLGVAEHMTYGFGPANNGANQTLYTSTLGFLMHFSARKNLFIGLVAFFLFS
jgi:hypothetical protein